MRLTESQDRIDRLEIFLVDLSQDKPYLGSLRKGEIVNESGYFVRKGNRTVYPRQNRSLVVRLETKDGVVGWGETYGLVAPKATAAIIDDLLSDFVMGQDPLKVESIHDQLYDLMRVRGYTGGFYLDALAAIDIALWDISGKIAGLSVSELLGGKQHDKIPAYVSGLPEDTLSKRCDMAVAWQVRGFHSVKFALPVADEGVTAELTALRKALGPESRIAVDLHWALTKDETISLARELEPLHPWFLEAPVATEDIESLETIAGQCGQQIAVGEEWRTYHDARLRIARKACHIVQPEMGHTGITEFMRIARLAIENSIQVIPHATIGSGIFLAASLQASAALPTEIAHEFQHSILIPFRHYIDDRIQCEEGQYTWTDSPGLGVEPSESMLASMTTIST